MRTRFVAETILCLRAQERVEASLKTQLEAAERR